MQHLQNTKEFVEAISVCGSPMVKAYCGLVALELTLKTAVGLTNHDVPSALRRLNIKQPKPGGHNLLGLAQRLGNEIATINVTNSDGTRRTAPQNSYPYIRYTTFDTDAWPAPVTTQADMSALAATVSRIRLYLKKHYGFQV
jgi:hypothetical protein